MPATAARRLAALLAAAALTGLTAPTSAWALDSSAHTVANHFNAQQAAAFSKAIEADLGARGARVALVFRAGRSRADMPKGIDYTHGAVWIYREIRTAGGGVVHGYAVYNLYAGDGKAWPVSESRLVQDYPLDFVRASSVDDVGVILPSPEMQRRLLNLVDSPTYAALHNPSYTLVANPFSAAHQNCTNFLLDLVAAAAWETSDPAQIRADLVAHFTPTTIKAGPLERWLGPVVDARLQTDDQPGPIRTATYESLAAFMRANGLITDAYVLRAQPAG